MKGQILILDDDVSLLDALKIALAFEGFDVTATSVFKRLYSLIEKTRPDVLILDVQLDDMDGREISQRLKRNAKTYDIPIILISAFHQSRKSLTKSRANDFLEKPFEIDDLIEKIEKYIPKAIL